LSESLPLAGKTALVTGGAARVGAAIGRALHQAGAHLIVHYRRSRQSAEQLRNELTACGPNSVSLVQGDLLDSAALPGLATSALAIKDRLDILVNNASSYYPTPLGEATEAQWNDLVGSNAKAPFFLAQALAPALRARRGVIINLLDVHAERPQPEHPIYCMAKAANAMLVKSLALELAPDVRVNGVSPGAILWPKEYFSDEARRQILSRIPLGKPGTPEDIAATVLFLAQSDYITGQIVAVDGGRTIQQ
jgi:pteridine reductase